MEGRGLLAAALASTSVFLLDAFLPVHVESASINQLSDAMGKIIFVFCGVTAMGAILVWYIFPNVDLHKTTLSEKLSLEGVKESMKRRSVWLQAFILLCGYVGYKCTDDFGLYAKDVFGFNDIESAHIATISFWVRPIAAVAAGVLGDRFGHSKMTSISFVILILGSLVITSDILQPDPFILIAITIASTSLGIYGLRGLYYALFQESKIPLSITGSAIGFISVIGYTPDVFMGPLMGVILDNNPGVLGHQYLFGVLVLFGIVGLTSSLLFRRNVAQELSLK